MTTRSTSFRLEPEVLARLDADRGTTSRSDYIRALIMGPTRPAFPVTPGRIDLYRSNVTPRFKVEVKAKGR